MSNEWGENHPAIIDAASERIIRIEQALGHVAKAVELELADIVILNGELDDETKTRLTKLGEHLVRLSNGSNSLISDISSVTKLPLGSVAGSLSPMREIQSPHQIAASTELEKTPSLPAEALKSTEESGEQQEEKEPVNLYSRIIDIDSIPVMERKNGNAPVEISISDNTTLRVGQRNVPLSDHERYLFNSLMILRDKPRSAEELRGFGFYPGAKPTTAQQTFSKSMANLAERLNGAAGIEIVKKIGKSRSTRYAVNPNAVVADVRTEEERAKTLNDVKKN